MFLCNVATWWRFDDGRQRQCECAIKAAASHRLSPSSSIDRYFDCAANARGVHGLAANQATHAAIQRAGPKQVEVRAQSRRQLSPPTTPQHPSTRLRLSASAQEAGEYMTPRAIAARLLLTLARGPRLARGEESSGLA